MDLQELLDVALAAARDAVEVHRRELGRVHVEEWSEKGTSDFVSRVDREAEERIVARIRTAFPYHGILAEEAATAPDAAPLANVFNAGPEYLWIVDPLDGTTNFLHGYPAYAASVAVAHRGEVVAGAVVAGATGEEWTAVRGGGARKDGRPIRVSGVDRAHLALVGTGFPFRQPERITAYLRQFEAVLRQTSDIRRAGSAALDLCHVASGYLDGFWELVLAPWDVAAGTLLIREAGGLVTHLDGDPDVLAGGSILAGNPFVHNELRRLLGDVETPTPGPG